MLNFLPFRFPDHVQFRNGILLDIPEDVDLTAVETHLHTQLRPHFLPADLLLLRFPPWHMREPEPRNDEQEGISRIASRFPHLSVRIFSSHGYQHFIGRNLSETYDRVFAFEEKPETLIDGLRKRELVDMVKRSEALLSASDNYTFHLPSGAYTDDFLRAGNIQTSMHNLDTLFFWMLPYLSDVDGILVDTWSIGSVALNCSRLIGVYDGTRKRNLRVEIRSSYVDGRAATRSQLFELAERASYGLSSPFLSIFSTTMTGLSIKNLRSALTTKECPSDLIRLLVLFRRASSKIKVEGETVPELCSLELSGYRNDNTSDKVAIDIDRTTYFPVFAKEKETSLTRTFARQNQSFFSNYGSWNCIRIHADSIVERQVYRHHGIYIDVLKMLRTDRFRARLEAILEELDRVPRMVIVPPHDAGVALAEFVASFFEKKEKFRPRVVVHLDLGLPSSDEVDSHKSQEMEAVHAELRSLSHTDTILVLDDVVTTGTRLSAYQKRLRDTEYKGEICYLVGVQRMQARSEYHRLSSTLEQNNLGRPHKVRNVESVVLPNWSKIDCPLCVEQVFLEELINSQPDPYPSWIHARLNLLRKTTSEGLSDDVFLKPPSASALSLTINSFFAPPNAPQAVVLSSVAAAIQEMRTCEDRKKRLDSRGFPVRTLFSARDLERYSDGILRASILRSLVPRELRRFSVEKEKLLVERAEAIFEAQEDDDKNTHAELALALGLGKIPMDAVNERTKRVLRDLDRLELVSIAEAGQA